MKVLIFVAFYIVCSILSPSNAGDYFTVPKDSFARAALRCSLKGGGNLFYAKSQEEIDEVRSEFFWRYKTYVNDYIEAHDRFWVGIHDHFNTGNITTVDGNKQFYSNWTSGEPILGDGKRWTILIRNGTYQMVSADTTYSAICRKKSGCESEAVVGDGYTFLDRHTAEYKFYQRENNTFEDAHLTCSADGSQLFYPESRAEAEDVFESIVREDVDHIMIGIHDVFRTGSFQTVDGKIDFYINFEDGVVRSIHNISESLSLKRDLYFEYANADATDRFVCKKNRLCPDEGLQFDTDWNELLEYISYEENFRDAEKRCAMKSGTLAAPQTAEQMYYLRSRFERRNTDFEIWIGHNKTFKNEDGNNTDDELSNRTDFKRCRMQLNETVTTDDCESKKPFVCQYNATLKGFTSSSKTSKEYAVSSYALSRTDAMYACERSNSRLAMPLTPEDVDFLRKISSHRSLFLIGYHSYSVYRESKDAIDFNGVRYIPHNLKWTIENPDKDIGFCTALRKDGLLMKVDCDIKGYFICEREKVSDYVLPEYSFLERYNASYVAYVTNETFPTAALRCSFDDAELFYPSSIREGVDVLRELFQPEVDLVWLGMHTWFSKKPRTSSGRRNGPVHWNKTTKEPYASLASLNRSSMSLAMQSWDTELPFVCKRKSRDDDCLSAEDLEGYKVVEERGAAYKYLELDYHEVELANLYCLSEGARLFYPDSAAETRLVFDTIIPDGVDQIKIGVHDAFGTGSLRTVYGKSDFYANWRWGHPKKDGDWVILNRDRSFEYSKNNLRGRFVCKKPIARTCRHDITYNVDTDEILHFYETKERFNKAEKICESANGTLIAPRTESEREQVLKSFEVMKSGGKYDIWSGIRSDELEDETESRKCTFFVDSENVKSSSCKSRKSFVCKIDYQEDHRVEGNRHFLVSVTNLTRDDAEKYCQKRNYSLAIPSTIADLDLLTSVVNSTAILDKESIYLGYIYVKVDGERHEMKPKKGTPDFPEAELRARLAKWTYFIKGNEKEICVAMFREGILTALPCDFYAHFICEKNKS